MEFIISYRKHVSN